MITNDRQFKIAKAQLTKFQEWIKEFDLHATAKKVGSEVLAQAELDALIDQAQALEDEIKEYELLKSGSITNFKANNLSELHTMLIRARVAQNLSQRELAELVGLKEQQIQRYEAQKYASASLSRVLEIAKSLNIDFSGVARISYSPKSISQQKEMDLNIEWDRFPIKEMYARGWFEGFTGSLQELIQQGTELVQEFITSATRKPAVKLYRRFVRSETQLNPYALLAWECRIMHKAKKIENVKEYRPQLVTAEWLDELRKLSKLPKGPLEAQARLIDVGITLIIEPHLPNTYLDGAALLMDGDTPVIGMTLRHDRLDNFWFVLFHEIMHELHHLKKGKLENIFDDLDVTDTTAMELEADQLAGDALISPEEWSTALPRFVQSSSAVQSFAAKIKVSPAIVAGRIRRETGNYMILTDIVGQNEVRKQFPDVNFGI